MFTSFQSKFIIIQ